MDKVLALSKIFSEVEKLNTLITEWIGPERVIHDENTIFIKLRKNDNEREFLLRVTCGEGFPLEPADYVFVNPETKEDDSREYWPIHNNDAFKFNENPRWICIAGTLAYKNHHKEYKFNSKFNSLNQTVFHIFKEINGWKRDG